MVDNLTFKFDLNLVSLVNSKLYEISFWIRLQIRIKIAGGIRIRTNRHTAGCGG